MGKIILAAAVLLVGWYLFAPGALSDTEKKVEPYLKAVENVPQPHKMESQYSPIQRRADYLFRLMEAAFGEKVETTLDYPCAASDFCKGRIRNIELPIRAHDISAETYIALPSETGTGTGTKDSDDYLFACLMTMTALMETVPSYTASKTGLAFDTARETGSAEGHFMALNYSLSHEDGAWTCKIYRPQ